MTDFEQGITDTLDKDAEQLRTMGYKQVRINKLLHLLTFIPSNSMNM
jgi:hypothetical protein